MSLGSSFKGIDQNFSNMDVGLQGLLSKFRFDKQGRPILDVSGNINANDIFSNTEVDDSYILNDTSSNSSSSIDYEELCEDEKISDEMGICIGCNIRNIKQKKMDYKNKNKQYKTESNLKKKQKKFYYKNSKNSKNSNKKLKYYI